MERSAREVVISGLAAGGASAVAIVLLEVRMRRSGSRWLGTAQHGRRRLAALAVVAVAVAGCQAAAGAAGHRVASTATRPAPSSPAAALPAPSPTATRQPSGRSPR